MFQFFIEKYQLNDKKAYIEGSDVNHIKNVLRMKEGDELNVVIEGDSNEYRCEIDSFDEERVNLTVRFIKESDVELPSKIYLLQGLPKSDKLELIIQKTVELGVYEIIPISLKRSVVKLDDKKVKSKVSRWNGISEAAAKQSKRRIVPDVLEPMSLKEAIKYLKDEKVDIKLLPYEMADMDAMDKTRSIVSGIEKGKSIAVLIGPEGGFDESEIEIAEEAGFEVITLGHRILRTETAPIMVLSWLVYELE
ncbi:MAG: 16S rRNA (uracil(1498)-N(3))-methyltransferase [Lachnospiraceae bacterium]|nr:16S rRNA (uracil(1498)-N(3))-methyltransferase [Lachnospiraceae bacterium]